MQIRQYQIKDIPEMIAVWNEVVEDGIAFPQEENLTEETDQPLEDPETILLIDSWENQEAIDIHHASPMMATIAALREKYDLHMTVERYVSAETPETENRFIRK